MTNVTIVLGEMHKIFSDPVLSSGRLVANRDKKLNIVISDELKPTELQNGVNEEFGRFSIGATVMWGVGILVAISFGIAVIIFMSALDVFHELFGKIAYSFKIPTEYPQRLYFLAIPIVGALIISFLPKMFSGTDGGVGRFIMAWLVNDQGRTLSRLSSRLSVGTSLGRVKEIHVWNPMRFSEPYRDDFLLMLLKRRSIPITLYIHHDEISRWATFASLNGVSWTVKDEASATAGNPSGRRLFDEHMKWVARPDAGPAIPLETVARMARHLMGPSGESFLGILLLSSTRFAVSPWRECLERNPELSSGLVSLNYAAAIAQQAASAFDNAERDAASAIRGVFERSIRDYGFLRESAFFETAIVMPVLRLSEGALPPSWQQIKSSLNFRVRGTNRLFTESTALFSNLVRFRDDAFISRDYRELVEAFADAARADGNLLCSGVLADMCRYPVGANGQTPAAGDSDFQTRRVFDGVAIAQLSSLAELFEGAGRFAAALDLYSWLDAVDPVVAHIRKARLIERLGQYDEALRFLLSRYRTQMETALASLGSDGMGSAALPVSLCTSAIRYHLQWAWITISGELAKPDGNKETADRILHRLLQVSELPQVDFLTAMDRWQLWNYLGLLHEWNGRYDAAAQHHKRAADLPGVPLRWKGASLINAGIATRKEFCGAPTADSLDALSKAYASIIRGTELKLSLGDVDEAAVGLHNAAYVGLLMCRLDRNSEPGPEGIIRLTSLGLGILGNTRSVKKRALLSAEQLFARLILAASKPAETLNISGAARADLEDIATLRQAGHIPESDERDILTLKGILSGEQETTLAQMLDAIRASLPSPGGAQAAA